jgi:hypothetical protein
MGACCVDEVCVATTLEPECDALGGYWYANETCPVYECPLTCLNAIYHNGDPVGGATGSQCDLSNPFVAEAADDFVLPGAGTVDLTTVIAWVDFWNGPSDASPAFFDGVNVTVYLNDLITLPYPSPGGQPISPPDSACSHMANIPGGIVYTVQLLPGSYEYYNDDLGWRLILPVEVTLNAGEIYWLGVQPIMLFGSYGQTGWTPTDIITGNIAEQIFPLLGTTVWTPTDRPRDMAFCLLGPGCEYVIGDVNNSGNYNGLDITFGVAFFKGGIDPICDTCDCPPHPFFWVCGDVNGSCSYNGLDITYGVAFLKGGPGLIPCPDCPPIGLAGDNSQPERPSVIKTKTIFQQKPISK